MLRSVLLHWPGEELCYTEPPDRWLMLERPDLDRARRQAETIASFYESRGITVCFTNPSAAPPPNMLFMRDLVWVGPDGAVLARMGSQQRAGEERFAAEALAQSGIPIIATPRGTETFEGADAIWLEPSTLLLGLGGRTNAGGLARLRRTIESPAISIHPVALPDGVQHLLGVLEFVDENKAAVWEGRTPPSLMDWLRERGVALIVLPDGPELAMGRAMNWVCLGPGEVVMPAGCPETRRRLKDAGVGVYALDVSEYIRAGGALGCLTGVLHRE